MWGLVWVLEVGIRKEVRFEKRNDGGLKKRYYRNKIRKGLKGEML